MNAMIADVKDEAAQPQPTAPPMSLFQCSTTFLALPVHLEKKHDACVTLARSLRTSILPVCVNNNPGSAQIEKTDHIHYRKTDNLHFQSLNLIDVIYSKTVKGLFDKHL